MKKKLFIFITTLFFFICTVSSCSFFNKELDPNTFNDYTKELLTPLIGNDEFTQHFLFKDPTSYGLSETGDISLPTPTVSNTLSKVLINLIFSDLNNYNYDKLNFDQQMTYNILTNLVDSINDKTSEMSYLDNNYLGSYLGYQAQLPLLLHEYKFYDINDVYNYFSFLDLVPDTFKAYVDFEIEKADEGFGMQNFVIDKVINQCNEFINDAENHFLIKTFEKRIEDLILPLNIKNELIETNRQKITGPLIEGYKYIKNNLPILYNKATNNLGLSYYKIGKEYYTYLFHNETGYDISISDAITYINNKVDENYQELNEIIKNNLDIQETAKNSSLLNTTPENQINLYKTLINKNFPKLNYDPNIIINYIDESMENHFSPAAFISSPIDSLENQYIYLNNSSIKDDYNYLYSTLAHEGLPGHLYQDVYFKSQDVNLIRKIIKNSGYAEGWATYAEIYSFSFVEGEDKIVAEYLKNENELLGALQCRLDMGIHYEGWDANDVLAYLNTYLNGYTIENATKILEQIIEIPTNSQIYFFTYFKITDMYDRTKSALGSNFNELDFHKQILDCGPIPLKYVEKVINQYIENNK